MSTVSESKPWWAMTSAENPLGIDSQPFTTASPRAQIVLSVFSLTSLSSPSGVELGAERDVRENTLRTIRSEEHTSELQSRLHLVCRLLLEKKKKTPHQ